MRTDRYLKCILTVIACELLWFAVKDGAPRVAAQQEPAPVVITGFQIGKAVYSVLPVGVAGNWPSVTGERFPPAFVRETVRVQVPGTVQVDVPLPVSIRQPVTVQTGQRPLSVESVQAQGSQRPGY